MYRYFFTGTILLLLIAAGGVGLYGRRLPDADFTYVLDGSLKTLDPARMSWLTDIRMALGLWEGLTSYDPRSTEPGAGVAYFPPQISDDGLTYTFALREEACWSNGEPVTTADFVYGWRRAIEPGTASDYAFLITNNIAGARQYSDWRNRAVKTLTILRDLCQAVAVTPEDMEFIKSLRLGGSGAEKPDWREIARCFRREHLAEMGRSVLGLIIQYVAAPSKREETLVMARDVGRGFGETLAQLGLPLTDAVEAFIRHRDPILNAATHLMNKRQANRRIVKAIPLVAHVMDEALVALVAAHQQYQSIHLEKSSGGTTG